MRRSEPFGGCRSARHAHPLAPGASRPGETCARVRPFVRPSESDDGPDTTDASFWRIVFGAVARSNAQRGSDLVIAETGPFERITFEPGKMGGRACIRGMRITVGTIVGLVAEGETTEAILAACPDLEPEDIRHARACNGLVVARPALVDIAGTLPDQITAGAAQPAEKFAEIPEIRPPGPK